MGLVGDGDLAKRHIGLQHHVFSESYPLLEDIRMGSTAQAIFERSSEMGAAERKLRSKLYG
jgi:hypothetical protein